MSRRRGLRIFSEQEEFEIDRKEKHQNSKMKQNARDGLTGSGIY